MKTFSYSDLRSNLAEVFKLVSNGEEVVISKNKGRKMVAVILPYEKHTRKKRPLGILKKLASFSIKEDFKLSDQEFLNS
jgi:prevent-host-death family protein